MKLKSYGKLSTYIYVSSVVVNTACATASTPPLHAGCNYENATGIAYILINLNASFSSISTLIGAFAYISGLALVVTAVVKLKQFRDNPQQVTISTPFIYMAAGVGLIYLPSLINVTFQSIFDTNNTVVNFQNLSDIYSEVTLLDPNYCVQQSPTVLPAGQQ